MKLFDALRRAFAPKKDKEERMKIPPASSSLSQGENGITHSVRKGAYMHALRTLGDFELHMSNNSKKDRYADSLYIDETTGMFGISRILLHLYGSDYEAMNALVHMSLALAVESNESRKPEHPQPAPEPARQPTPVAAYAKVSAGDRPFTGNLNTDFLQS